MARRALAVLTVVSAAFISSCIVMPQSAGARVFPALAGAGQATVGTIHVNNVDDPDPTVPCYTSYLTINGVSLSGTLLFGGTRYTGSFAIGTLNGVQVFCDNSRPDDCSDPSCLVDPLLYPPSVLDDATGPWYGIRNTAVALSGTNDSGQTVSGTCRGHLYGRLLETNCTATLNGTSSRSFVLTIAAAGQSATKTGTGVFVAQSLAGNTITNTL